MRRSRTNGQAPPPEQPRVAAGPFHVDRDAVYTPQHLADGLGVPLSGVKRDIRSGKLKAGRIRGRTMILGAAVLEWIEAGTGRRRAD
jgi:hypothetical protein